MKGITPVIAVILLLLITVAMVGFAFIWFGRVASSAQNATQAELEANINRQAQRISIDSVTGVTMVVRAIGSQAVPTSSISVVDNGAVRTCVWSGGITSIAPGSFGTCTLSAACPAGNTIRVTASGNFDEREC